MRIDPYFYEQPKKEFVEDLKRDVHESAPLGFGNGEMSEGLCDASGIYIKERFPEDGEGLLLTAYDDFEKFLSVCRIGGNSYPLIFRRKDMECAEAYEIEVNDRECIIYSSDTEGARRAVIYIEGEMTKNEGAFLSRGVISRKPYIKDRITRGFFSPTNRPPHYGDELLDDVDYYPEEYLNRLAHSGTNGLWIYTSFRALIASPYFDDDKEKCEKRIKKLTKVVNKCKKYGLKVFIFAIEPHGLSPEEARQHPELVSGVGDGRFETICLRKPAARDHLISTVRRLFESVPDLGGYIDITAGERPTSCPSLAAYKKCPLCKEYSRGENLAYTASLIKEGIRQAGTGAEFISWTYGHRYWEYSDIREYIEKTDDDVIFMQNYEDRGYNEQLGKKRVAFDYWLSYKGPSELFEETAKVTKPKSKRLYAKMQVCCSHELATVPYIPVPGILFDKYKSARELGVSGIMECWYFGNYPSIMSKCSGELSFTDLLSDKRAFLFDFAARCCGKSIAEQLVSAWEKFEEGYVNYPTNIMFSYYGPMHDGVVWELPLLPTNSPLPRSWLLTDPPAGDRIGECLFSGHTLDEALLLSQRMRDCWSAGIKALPLPKNHEGYTVASALSILFASGVNILRYFDLRRRLGEEDGDANALLSEMRELIWQEKQNSLDMARLCRIDKTLGYHSEAEGFKFFEKKLFDRIEKLELVLKNEFPEVEKRISEGRCPLGFFYAEGEKFYSLDGSRIELGGGREVSVRLDGDHLIYNIKSQNGDIIQLGQEFRLGIPEAAVVFSTSYDPTVTIHPESLSTYKKGIRLDSGATSHQSVFGEGVEKELAKYEYSSECRDGFAFHTVKAAIPDGKWNRRTAIRIRLVVGDSYLSPSSEPTVTLGKGAFSPDEFAFFKP